MTEQEIISSAMTVSVFATLLCTIFYAKMAWDEARWLFYKPNYTSFCWGFIIPFLWHSLLFIWGVCFTVYGAFFTYECASWLFNLI